MTIHWKSTPLGEVSRYRKEFIVIDDLKEYKRCRVQLHAKGIVLRDVIEGTRIKTKRQQQCKAGQFLVAEIDAKVGGYGIIPEELNGAIVSSHYFLFEINEKRLNKRFLDYFLRTPYFHDQVLARGSTNYAAIRPHDVLAYVIPLPPLSEQRRIVAKIEKLAAKIEEARLIRQQVNLKVASITDSFLIRLTINAKEKPGWKIGPVSQFVEVNPSRKGNINLDPDDEVSFVPMSAVDKIKGEILSPSIRPFYEVSKGYTWFVNNDVIFARITPCMQNGKAAIAHDLVNGTGFGSTEFHVLRPGPFILGKWLHYLVRQKSLLDDAKDYFKGTAGQQRVPADFFYKKEIIVPPLNDQHRILAYLNKLQNKVDALKQLQKQTATELDALLPSIFDKAFKG